MNDQALIPLPISPFLSAFREAAHRVFRHKNNFFKPESSTLDPFIVSLGYWIFAEDFIDTRRNPFGIGSRVCTYYGTLYTVRSLNFRNMQDHLAWDKYEAGIKRLLTWALELELAEMEGK